MKKFKEWLQLKEMAPQQPQASQQPQMPDPKALAVAVQGTNIPPKAVSDYAKKAMEAQKAGIDQKKMSIAQDWANKYRQSQGIQ